MPICPVCLRSYPRLYTAPGGGAACLACNALEKDINLARLQGYIDGDIRRALMAAIRKLGGRGSRNRHCRLPDARYGHLGRQGGYARAREPCCLWLAGGSLRKGESRFNT